MSLYHSANRHNVTLHLNVGRPMFRSTRILEVRVLEGRAVVRLRGELELEPPPPLATSKCFNTGQGVVAGYPRIIRHTFLDPTCAMPRSKIRIKCLSRSLFTAPNRWWERVPLYTTESMPILTRLKLHSLSATVSSSSDDFGMASEYNTLGTASLGDR